MSASASEYPLTPPLPGGGVDLASRGERPVRPLGWLKCRGARSGLYGTGKVGSSTTPADALGSRRLPQETLLFST